ncbi:hypothetical protein C8Q78DRAFT_1074896 [Trametes maxima]|nr:hypothetical protein C8Q78DRAFT_1074896 [Trametes maxima]
MSSISLSIAIVGGTGRLGKSPRYPSRHLACLTTDGSSRRYYISTATLTEFASNFHAVHVLTRDPSSAPAQDLLAKGATLYEFDESSLPTILDEAFKGVDVVVNVLPTLAIPTATYQEVEEAASRSSAKVYFPSEFGSDHRLHDISAYDNPTWREKAKLGTDARQRLRGRKVVSVFTPVWMEFAISPVLGIDVEKNTYTCYGLPSQRFSTASIADVGRSIVRLAILASDSDTTSKVPDELRIAGSTISYEDVRDIVARVKGLPKGKIVSEDLERFKPDILQETDKNYGHYIRVVIGEGKADFSSDNVDDLVDPNETFWRWKSVEQLA